jgi:hypothetical protein
MAALGGDMSRQGAITRRAFADVTEVAAESDTDSKASIPDELERQTKRRAFAVFGAVSKQSASIYCRRSFFGCLDMKERLEEASTKAGFD